MEKINSECDIMVNTSAEPAEPLKKIHGSEPEHLPA
jgi:hypothetical protein